ncbi:MAG: hypothetical protein EBV28_10725 [Betaproteobacteria bacterium]|nr:hypothetical protein [Betaproteobacteria bacterium]
MHLCSQGLQDACIKFCGNLSKGPLCGKRLSELCPHKSLPNDLQLGKRFKGRADGCGAAVK